MISRDKIENRKSTEKINDTPTSFFENINKNDNYIYKKKKKINLLNQKFKSGHSSLHP